MRTQLIIFIGFILFIFQAQAQQLFELRPEYNIEENPFFEGIDTVPPSELGVWNIVEITHNLDPEDQLITLDLEPELSMTFEMEYSFLDSLGITTWKGNNLDPDYPNSVAYFRSYLDSLRGYVTLNDSVAYQLHDIGGNHQIIAKIDYDQDCDAHLVPYYRASGLKFFHPPILLHCGGLRIYRLIVAYTPQFTSTFPANNRQNRINTYIHEMVENMNNTYINSNSNVRVRLALSYETSNEHGSKGADLDDFVNKASHRRGGSSYTRYEQIHNLVIQYGADAAMLLVSYNAGGRADRQKNMALAAKNVAGPRIDRDNDNAALAGNFAFNGNFTAAHEVGHMFDLDHHRGSYNFFEKLVLDRKKAYGHQGTTFESVMSKGPQTRVSLYSDPSLFYPDLQSAGSSKAKARNYIQGHHSNLFRYNDPYDLHIAGRIIYYNQMSSRFAYNRLWVSNTRIDPGAWWNLKSQNFVKLLPGTLIEQGAEANIEIETCQNSQIFREKEESDPLEALEHLDHHDTDELLIYPNPTDRGFTVDFGNCEFCNYDIEVMDMNGRLVVSMKGVNQNRLNIDLAEFNNGIYILRALNNTDSKLTVHKIIKQ